jgi:P27 family predicted phage terminase small subunit
MRGRRPERIVNGSATVQRVPAPPSWLGKDARAEWRRVAPILVERKVLTDADLGALEAYCTAAGLVRECQRAINADGVVVQTEKGLKRHPAIGVQNAALTQMRLIGGELGLSPVSRSRPTIRDEGEDDESNPLAD